MRSSMTLEDNGSKGVAAPSGESKHNSPDSKSGDNSSDSRLVFEHSLTHQNTSFTIAPKETNKKSSGALDAIDHSKQQQQQLCTDGDPQFVDAVTNAGDDQTAATTDQTIRPNEQSEEKESSSTDEKNKAEIVGGTAVNGNGDLSINGKILDHQIDAKNPKPAAEKKKAVDLAKVPIDKSKGDDSKKDALFTSKDTLVSFNAVLISKDNAQPSNSETEAKTVLVSMTSNSALSEPEKAAQSRDKAATISLVERSKLTTNCLLTPALVAQKALSESKDKIQMQNIVGTVNEATSETVLGAKAGSVSASEKGQEKNNTKSASTIQPMSSQPPPSSGEPTPLTAEKTSTTDYHESARRKEQPVSQDLSRLLPTNQSIDVLQDPTISPGDFKADSRVAHDPKTAKETKQLSSSENKASSGKIQHGLEVAATGSSHIDRPHDERSRIHARKSLDAEKGEIKHPPKPAKDVKGTQVFAHAKEIVIAEAALEQQKITFSSDGQQLEGLLGEGVLEEAKLESEMDRSPFPRPKTDAIYNDTTTKAKGLPLFSDIQKKADFPRTTLTAHKEDNLRTGLVAQITSGTPDTSTRSINSTTASSHQSKSFINAESASTKSVRAPDASQTVESKFGRPNSQQKAVLEDTTAAKASITSAIFPGKEDVLRNVEDMNDEKARSQVGAELPASTRTTETISFGRSGDEAAITKIGAHRKSKIFTTVSNNVASSLGKKTHSAILVTDRDDRTGKKPLPSNATKATPGASVSSESKSALGLSRNISSVLDSRETDYTISVTEKSDRTNPSSTGSKSLPSIATRTVTRVSVPIELKSVVTVSKDIVSSPDKKPNSVVLVTDKVIQRNPSSPSGQKSLPLDTTRLSTGASTINESKNAKAVSTIIVPALDSRKIDSLISVTEKTDRTNPSSTGTKSVSSDVTRSAIGTGALPSEPKIVGATKHIPKTIASPSDKESVNKSLSSVAGGINQTDPLLYTELQPCHPTKSTIDASARHESRGDRVAKTVSNSKIPALDRIHDSTTVFVTEKIDQINTRSATDKKLLSSVPSESKSDGATKALLSHNTSSLNKKHDFGTFASEGDKIYREPVSLPSYQKSQPLDATEGTGQTGVRSESTNRGSFNTFSNRDPLLMDKKHDSTRLVSNAGKIDRAVPYSFPKTKSQSSGTTKYTTGGDAPGEVKRNSDSTTVSNNITSSLYRKQESAMSKNDKIDPTNPSSFSEQRSEQSDATESTAGGGVPGEVKRNSAATANSNNAASSLDRQQDSAMSANDKIHRTNPSTFPEQTSQPFAATKSTTGEGVPAESRRNSAAAADSNNITSSRDRKQDSTMLANDKIDSTNPSSPTVKVSSPAHVKRPTSGADVSSESESGVAATTASNTSVSVLARKSDSVVLVNAKIDRTNTSSNVVGATIELKNDGVVATSSNLCPLFSSTERRPKQLICVVNEIYQPKPSSQQTPATGDVTQTGGPSESKIDRNADAPSDKIASFSDEEHDFEKLATTTDKNCPPTNLRSISTEAQDGGGASDEKALRLVLASQSTSEKPGSLSQSKSKLRPAFETSNASTTLSGATTKTKTAAQVEVRQDRVLPNGIQGQKRKLPIHETAKYSENGQKKSVGSTGSSPTVGVLEGPPQKVPRIAEKTAQKPPARPKNLMELTAQMDESKRDYHKLMLFRLFQQTDNSKLQQMCGETDAKAVGIERKSKGHASTDDRTRDIALGLLPLALQEFRDVIDSKRVVDFGCHAKRRTGFSSKSLPELEGIVKAKFVASDVGKKAYAKSGNAYAEQKRGVGSFSPFSLDFNECSITAIAKWATKEKPESRDKKTDGGQKRKVLDTTPTYCQAVTSLFRKCQVCASYGHYEIECNKMIEDDAIELAHETMVYANVRELLEQKRDRLDLGFRHYGYEETLAKDRALADEVEIDHARKHLACEVCQSGLDDDHMLICDGCDKLFHLYCLSPQLKRVPKGDWFCKSCVDYNSEVSSDVEIEACGEFVIEQRKRPREEGTVNEDKKGLSTGDWQTAVSVIREEPESSTQPSELRGGKKRRTIADERTDIDGFVVHAKSTSDSPHASKLVHTWTRRAEDVSQEPITKGSMVACFFAEEDASPLVGTVLAVDAVARKVLVRRMDEWKDMMKDQGSDDIGDAPKRLEDYEIRAISSGSTVWYPADLMHIVARAPPKHVAAKFREDVLPARVAKERRHLPQQATAMTLLSRIS